MQNKKSVCLFLDKPVNRLAIGFFLALPVTLILIPLTAYGIIFGFNGIFNGVGLGFVVLALTAMGVAGVIAAWHRIIRDSQQLSKKQQIAIRRNLIFGVISSTVLSIWTLDTISEDALSLFFIFSSSFGGLLFLGTPVEKTVGSDDASQAQN